VRSMDRAPYLARTVGLAVAASRDGRRAYHAPYWYSLVLPFNNKTRQL